MKRTIAGLAAVLLAAAPLQAATSLEMESLKNILKNEEHTVYVDRCEVRRKFYLDVKILRKENSPYGMNIVILDELNTGDKIISVSIDLSQIKDNSLTIENLYDNNMDGVVDVAETINMNRKEFERYVHLLEKGYCEKPGAFPTREPSKEDQTKYDKIIREIIKSKSA